MERRYMMEDKIIIMAFCLYIVDIQTIVLYNHLRSTGKELAKCRLHLT